MEENSAKMHDAYAAMMNFRKKRLSDKEKKILVDLRNQMPTKDIMKKYSCGLDLLGRLQELI